MPVFALDYSILPIAAAMVGGQAPLQGPRLGPSSSSLFRKRFERWGTENRLLRHVPGHFVVGLPEGIFHFVSRKYHQFERWVEVDQ